MKRNGFTLVELLVTLSILALISGMVWPSFKNLTTTLHSDSVKGKWVQLLNFARSSAVMNNSIVTVCPMINSNCVDDLNQTWSVFTDNNKNKILDSDESLLRILTPNAKTRFAIFRADRPYFRFKPESSGIYSGSLKGFSICPTGKADKYSHHITVNINGRVGVKTERTANDIPIRNGEAIVCPA